MTERMASRWMTVWRLDTGELEAIRKDAVKMRFGNNEHNASLAAI